LRTKPCGSVISSGITCPFGQLSRSPGHISDSLLTRSPLTLAGPCDLHVLATPPAFRLSQDQTLQLFFVARVTPDARCATPHLHAGLRPRLTLSRLAFILEEESVLNRSATPDLHPRLRAVVTAYRPAKVDRSVDSRSTRRASPPAKRASSARLKHLLAATPAQLSPSRGGLLKIIDQKINHLRVCTTKTFEIARSAPVHGGRSSFTSSRRKSDYSLFKEHTESTPVRAMRNPSRLFVKRLHPLTAVAFV
jgi:hypothetical protein